LISICFNNVKKRIIPMKTFKQYSNLALFSTLFMLTLFAAGCGSSSDNAAIADPATPSTVVSTNPADDVTTAKLNKKITALFREELDPATVDETTFTLAYDANGTHVDGTVSYSDNTMIFTPDTDLTAATKYTATITTGVKYADGTSSLSVDYVWSFTTAAETDLVAPTVTSTDPTGIDVPLNRSVSALFSEALDPTTVTPATFTLAYEANGTAVDGTVSYASNTMTFVPTINLDSNTEYNATITTGVTDLADNNLSLEYSWNFTTGTTIAAGPAPVNLGTAGDFVILSKSGISTTGSTMITGDIGSSPVALTYITGFDLTSDGDTTYRKSIYVTEKVYAADLTPPTPSKMTTAVSDMEIAYTDATGRTLPDFTELGAGNISGRTLVPGLYKWGTGLLITSDVVLNGGANDVWIFQIAKGLTVNSGVNITLAGGALAKNVFWQVAEEVSLGTTTAFKGIIMSQTKIVLNTLASVDGRLLAQTAVTLDANVVTQPAN
jgi:hypothetical protein